MHDMKHLMRDHFLRYASYVILDRAIPHINDGLKPVQRRFLYTLLLMDDGKFHKVANAVGQTMAYHPHGDAPIKEALTNIAVKGFLLDTQGNFGNPLTGDPAAAARYIETRLSALARETLFNKDLTIFTPSYDGRNQEPVTLPAKIPLLLLQGADGIAVGMATHILPHNFKELLEAEIAILEGKSFKIVPDFPTGGLADVSEYDKGRGKVRLRARIDVVDPKTLRIREICYSTTTESLIRSIDEAAKKGHIKIDSIFDYTAEEVNIEIKLPRGQQAEELLDHLYAHTECEVALSSQIVVIKDDLPVELTVDDVLQHHTVLLQGYLKRELEIEEARLLQYIFDRTLEQLFIEHKIYQRIEEVEAYDEVYQVLDKGFKPHLHLLSRPPVRDDYDKLLQIPIRRIARFDRDKNEADIRSAADKLKGVRSNLKELTAYTIRYLQGLIARFASDFPRRTKVRRMEELDIRAITTKQMTVGVDTKTGYIGTKVRGDQEITCTNFDKLLILQRNGTYKVVNVPEKLYVGIDGDAIAYTGIADKTTTLTVAAIEPKTGLPYGKRFVVERFILDKPYRYLEEGMRFQLLTAATSPKLLLRLKARETTKEVDASKLLVKGVQARGVRLGTQAVSKISLAK